MAARKAKAGPVSLREGFDAAVASATHLQPKGMHAGAVAAGQMIATQIDLVVNDEETPLADKVKAMYLVPHVMGVMRELLLTPQSRAVNKQPQRGSSGDPDGEGALEGLERRGGRPHLVG